jgi:23S rRNA-/tRNA-specific pseudouridylate synthase
MQKTAGTLLHSRNRKAGSMLQLQLRKKSLKEREPELLLKNKNNAEKVILFQLSPVLSPNQKKFG